MPHAKGAYLGGIRAIEDLRLRCYVDPDTGCWHCRMYKDKAGVPNVRIVTPDTGEELKMSVRRAALYLVSGKPLPKGHLAYAKANCDSIDCGNPDHARSGTKKQWGRALSLKGTQKGLPRKIAAARKQAETKRLLTPQQVREIRRSDETDLSLSRRYGASRFVIWAVRHGQSYAGVPSGPTSVFNLGG